MGNHGSLPALSRAVYNYNLAFEKLFFDVGLDISFNVFHKYVYISGFISLNIECFV